MQDPNPNPDRPPDSALDARATRADSEGLVHFLVESTSGTGLTHEALGRAVRALVCERDYLRRVRDQRHADYDGIVRDLLENIDELEQLLERQRAAYREERSLLESELGATRRLRATLEREREALECDREAWRARAQRTLWESVRKTLEGWVTGRKRAC